MCWENVKNAITRIYYENIKYSIIMDICQNIKLETVKIFKWKKGKLYLQKQILKCWRIYYHNTHNH